MPEAAKSPGKKKTPALTSDSVLAAEVPWPSYCSAGIITKEQLEMIFQLDKQNVKTKLNLFNARGPAHVELMKVLLAGVNKDEALCYVLATLDELLTVDADIAKHFQTLMLSSETPKASGINDPYNPLMKLLTRSSPFVLEKTSSLLAKLLTYPISPGVVVPPLSGQYISKYLQTFSQWVFFLLQSVEPKDAADSPKTQWAVSALQILVSTPAGRAVCIESDGVPILYGILSGAGSATSVQLLYQVVFSLWSLSYSPEAALTMVNSKVGIIAKLVEVLKSMQKEKVIRVTLATLRNLLGTSTASADMVAAGIMPILTGLQPRKWADEDILEDIELLINALQVNLQTLTSWDVYKKELMSGKLDWTPSHKSEVFWKDNYKAFEANGFEGMKQLVFLLNSEDAQVRAIACNDVAELIKHHPEGRRLMTQHGAKVPAMQALKHPDASVQKYALACVQRLMVINWEYLSKS